VSQPLATTKIAFFEKSVAFAPRAGAGTLCGELRRFEQIAEKFIE
jgi:hypothetical protein